MLPSNSDTEYTVQFFFIYSRQKKLRICLVKNADKNSYMAIEAADIGTK